MKLPRWIHDRKLLRRAQEFKPAALCAKQGGTRRQALHLHALSAEPMEVDQNLERDRAIARGVQAPTQTVLPCVESAAMLFWALLASEQITMRKVDGWRSLAEKPDDQIIDLAA